MCWKRRICDVLTKSSYDQLVYDRFLSQILEKRKFYKVRK